MNTAFPRIIQLDHNHNYLVDGRPKLGLTECLKEAGLVEGHGDEAALVRGKAVHYAAFLLDQGKLMWDSVDDAIMPYVLGYERFLAESAWIPLERELMMYSPKLDICCMMDGRYRTPSLAATVCEIKTGENLQIYTKYQTALQHEIAKDNALYAEHRHALLLRQDGSYQLTEFTKPSDLVVGISAVNITKAKRGLL